MNLDPVSFLAGGIAALIAIILFIMVGTLLRPWLRANASAYRVPLSSVMGMRIRGNPAMLLIDGYVTLKKSGIDVSIEEVEGVYMDNRARISRADELVEAVKRGRKL